MDFLSGSTGFLIVIVLPMLLFFIYQVYHLITISINLKKAIAVETAKEQESANMQAAKDAEAALAEAKRMREEAEAIRAQAQADLEKAKQVSDESKSGKE